MTPFNHVHLGKPMVGFRMKDILVFFSELWGSGQTTEMYLDKALSGMVKREIITRLAADIDQKEMELRDLAEIRKETASRINQKYKDQEETLENMKKKLEESEKNVKSIKKEKKS